MGTQEEKRNRKETERERATTNGVIITSYVESSIVRSQNGKDPIKRIKVANPFSSKPPTARTRGYDRRAQLIAYAQELRQSPRFRPKNNSTPKTKPITRPWRYQRILTDDQSEVDQRRKKRNSWLSSCSGVCRRIRRMLKELSCPWQCNKGSRY